MLVITRIPTHRNNGSKISARERRAILTLVRDTFGGYTLEGPFEGAWVADDGRVYEEASYRPELTGGTSISKRSIENRAQELLTLACNLAQSSGLTWVEANNAIYGPG